MRDNKCPVYCSATAASLQAAALDNETTRDTLLRCAYGARVEFASAAAEIEVQQLHQHPLLMQGQQLLLVKRGICCLMIVFGPPPPYGHSRGHTFSL